MLETRTKVKQDRNKPVTWRKQPDSSFAWNVPQDGNCALKYKCETFQVPFSGHCWDKTWTSAQICCIGVAVQWNHTDPVEKVPVGGVHPTLTCGMAGVPWPHASPSCATICISLATDFFRNFFQDFFLFKTMSIQPNPAHSWEPCVVSTSALSFFTLWPVQFQLQPQFLHYLKVK